MYRPATPDDSRSCFVLFWGSLQDLAVRLGTTWDGTADEAWPRFESLYALLADAAAEWWVAEDPPSGDIIGYARSVHRGGLFELTEFFVQPERQALGVGRGLLERAFPVGRGEVRAIIATTDVRATARYLRADTNVQFPIFGFTGVPLADAAPLSLVPTRIEGDAAPAMMARASEIERAVLGYERGAHEAAWLLEHRQAYLYTDAAGEPVAYAFVGETSAGPIGALEPSHLPDVLLHVEGAVASAGHERFAVEVPAPNVVAMGHLLGRGYRIDPFLTLLMANRPFGRFDRFIGFSPPFIL